MKQSTKLYYGWLISCLFSFLACGIAILEAGEYYLNTLFFALIWFAWHTISCYTFFKWRNRVDDEIISEINKEALSLK